MRADAEPQVRSSALGMPLTLAPVGVRAGHCSHDWVKQPCGKIYLCWKCGAEKPREANDGKRHTGEAQQRGGETS